MNKQILYILSLSLLSLPVFAQIPRGTSMVGGSISFSHKSSNSPTGIKSTSTAFDVRPSYGLFLVKNLCVGAAVGYNFGKADEDLTVGQYSLSTRYRSISVGPFVRYYIPITSKLYALAHASYDRNWSRNKGNYPVQNVVTKERANSWTLGAGLSYFLNPHIALEGILSYSGRRSKNDTTPENVTFAHRNADGLGLSIGLQIFLRKSE
jgi:opacity protein-like surface antigen